MEMGWRLKPSKEEVEGAVPAGTRVEPDKETKG